MYCISVNIHIVILYIIFQGYHWGKLSMYTGNLSVLHLESATVSIKTSALKREGKR